MTPELKCLLEELGKVFVSEKNDHETGAVMVHAIMRRARANWVDLLGPLQTRDALEFSLMPTLIGGPVIDGTIMGQIALRNIGELSSFDLGCVALCRHGAITNLGNVHPLIDKLLNQDKKRGLQDKANLAASQAANGIELDSDFAVAQPTRFSQIIARLLDKPQ